MSERRGYKRLVGLLGDAATELGRLHELNVRQQRRLLEAGLLGEYEVICGGEGDQCGFMRMKKQIEEVLRRE